MSVINTYMKDNGRTPLGRFCNEYSDKSNRCSLGLSLSVGDLDLNFYPTTCICRPQWGVIPFEFRREFWCQKTRVLGLSCGISCVILCLAVLIQYRSVTDTHTETDRQTDRHTGTAYTALSIASRGKNVGDCSPIPPPLDIRPCADATRMLRGNCSR